jgi:hypothetical protein
VGVGAGVGVVAVVVFELVPQDIIQIDKKVMASKARIRAAVRVGCACVGPMFLSSFQVAAGKRCSRAARICLPYFDIRETHDSYIQEHRCFRVRTGK